MRAGPRAKVFVVGTWKDDGRERPQHRLRQWGDHDLRVGVCGRPEGFLFEYTIDPGHELGERQREPVRRGNPCARSGAGRVEPQRNQHLAPGLVGRQQRQRATTMQRGGQAGQPGEQRLARGQGQVAQHGRSGGPKARGG